jgi:hypothetical protein
MSDDKFGPFEPETGDALASEVLGIPLLWRPKQTTVLLKGGTFFTSFIPLTFKSKPFSGLLNSKPFSKLFSGTIGSRLGIK